ncbi:response regulator transcription factor [Variovorax paradoxus]|uniref:response regulator transcription factor n=1 Tax=Variovorax paradoxus TaxID=34073 RepID=UPI001931FBDF|nr:response regulator transcription factor [Variovorax paradoxus]
MSTSARAAVLLVDDHALVRLGFRALTQAHGAYTGEGMEALEASTLAEAMALYERHRCAIGLVLLDLALPDTQGLSGLVEFQARFPDATIAMLSGSRQPAQVQAALAMGAVAWLQKGGDLQELAHFLRRWREDGVPPPGDAADAADPATAPGQALGLRQQQVLRHVLEGMSNREIAEAMSLGEGTVKNHVTSLLLRFGMRSRSQLISRLGAQG